MRLGLERTAKLLDLLGDPHRRLASYHIAGTNGKGSVAATLTALLRARGLRVGTYTSPHLVDFRERVTINGDPISESAVVEFVNRWLPECDRIGATFFEATTALAFAYLDQQKVDVAVIETGLGGRLDSTNVLSPLVAGVTGIALDHTDLLGTTVEEIAREKAGIFKAGVPAVIGEPDDELRAVLLESAHASSADPVHVVEDEWEISNVIVDRGGTTMSLGRAGVSATVHTPLVGAHQARNTVTALAMLEMADGSTPDLSTVSEALEATRLPGRFDHRGRYLFDVAHNPAGFDALVATIREVQPARPVIALVSILSDKDWRVMIRSLKPVIDGLVVTVAPSAPEERKWDPEAAAAFARGSGMSTGAVHDFDRALATAVRDAATVLVTGSFHTVGDAMSRLQVNPLAD